MFKWIYSPFKAIRNWIQRNICGYNPGTGDTPPSDPCDKYHNIRLVRNPKDVIGRRMHRSGWPYAFKHLTTIVGDDGILFDDFIEQTFCYTHNPKPYTQPWVGVFHHPPHPPTFSNSQEALKLMFEKNCAFKASLPHLKMAITLSEHLAEFLQPRLDCPVVNLKHPIELSLNTWCPRRYETNCQKKLVQVGFYMRNTQLMHQFPDVRHFIKLKPHLSKDWMVEWDNRVRVHWDRLGIRTTFKTDVLPYKFCTPSQYDRLLAENVVLMEFFDLSAANGILDCIARNTPIITNRHPATIEYLGKDYPLFFDHPQQIPGLLHKVPEAHEHLKSMCKAWTRGEHFTSRIVEELANLK